MKKKAVEYTLKATKQDFAIEKIIDSESVYNFARKFYHDDISIYESCFIVLLNHASNVTGYAKISQGGICGTLVDKRLICKYAIEALVPLRLQGLPLSGKGWIGLCLSLRSVLSA